jgi:hypothetical protein
VVKLESHQRGFFLFGDLPTEDTVQAFTVVFAGEADF